MTVDKLCALASYAKTEAERRELYEDAVKLATLEAKHRV